MTRRGFLLALPVLPAMPMAPAPSSHEWMHASLETWGEWIRRARPGLQREGLPRQIVYGEVRIGDRIIVGRPVSDPRSA